MNRGAWVRMRMYGLRVFCLLWPLLFCSACLARPQSDILAHPPVQEFIDDMVQRHGLDRAMLEQVLGSAQRSDKVLGFMRAPAERRPWYSYREIMLDADRIKNGRTFLRRHAALLQRAQQQFGVDRYIIAAIAGVETRYGTYQGRHRVLDALVSLAFFSDRRRDFFRSELEQFFLLSVERGFEPDVLLGSYAGAMGISQFISSSYRNYAIDFNGDGVVDLFNDMEDAVGSIAHYLSVHGWRAGLPVADALMPADQTALDFLHMHADSRVASLRLHELGLLPDAVAPGDAAEVTVIRLQHEDDEVRYWLGYDNFVAITSYNRSYHYAMAVFLLSRALAEE